jgi:hypothetical protein
MFRRNTPHSDGVEHSDQTLWEPIIIIIIIIKYSVNILHH